MNLRASTLAPKARTPGRRVVQSGPTLVGWRGLADLRGPNTFHGRNASAAPPSAIVSAALRKAHGGPALAFFCAATNQRKGNALGTVSQKRRSFQIVIGATTIGVDASGDDQAARRRPPAPQTETTR